MIPIATSAPALPTLFVPHGAPTFALQPGEAGTALAELAQRLPQPRAILVVSAHWDTALPTLSISPHPATLHDYSGFPQALYALRYPAPGAVAWAMEARTLLEEAGLDVRLDPERGLDHGAWIPLRLMYPQAQLPVFTLSLQSRLGAAHHYQLGQALAPLREAGVLVLGSGNLTHNLRHFMQLQGSEHVPDYVTVFQGWMHDRLQACSINALLDYRASAPGALEAHPTDEHLLPLYFALGAAGPHYRTETVYSGIAHNMLAMDGFAFWPQAAPIHTSQSQGEQHG